MLSIVTSRYIAIEQNALYNTTNYTELLRIVRISNLLLQIYRLLSSKNPAE